MNLNIFKKNNEDDYTDVGEKKEVSKTKALIIGIALLIVGLVLSRIYADNDRKVSEPVAEVEETDDVEYDEIYDIGELMDTIEEDIEYIYGARRVDENNIRNKEVFRATEGERNHIGQQEIGTISRIYVDSELCTNERDQVVFEFYIGDEVKDLYTIIGTMTGETGKPVYYVAECGTYNMK